MLRLIRGQLKCLVVYQLSVCENSRQSVKGNEKSYHDYFLNCVTQFVVRRSERLLIYSINFTNSSETAATKKPLNSAR